MPIVETFSQPVLRRRSAWLVGLPVAGIVVLVGLTLAFQGDYRVAMTLGIVQGLGEFLPISSSAHLIITPCSSAGPAHGLPFSPAKRSMWRFIWARYWPSSSYSGVIGSSWC